MAILQDYPSSISQITLAQWTEWNELYYRDILRRKILANDIQNQSLKDIEILSLQAEEAVKSVSFFANIDLEDLSLNYNVREILTLFIATQTIWDAEIANIKNTFSQGVFRFEGNNYKVATIQIPDPMTLDFIERITPEAERFLGFLNGDWSLSHEVIGTNIQDLTNQDYNRDVNGFGKFKDLEMDKVWYVLTILQDVINEVFNDLK